MGTATRRDLLDLFDQLTPKIHDLTRALEEEVEKRPIARRLMTYPGVGPLTALAFELVIGTPERFQCGKQIASYVGLVPCLQSCAHIVLDTADIVRDGDLSHILTIDQPLADRITSCLLTNRRLSHCASIQS